MDGMIWSGQGKRWIDSQIKGGNSDYHIVGIYFDGNILVVSDGFGPTCGENMQNAVRIEMEGVWKGMKGFYLPMNRMDFQCAEGYTYREIFSGYLSDAASKIRQRIPEKPMVMAVACPERDAWKRDVDEYCMMLEEAFGTTEAGNVFPVLVSLPVACQNQMVHCGTMFYVGVEREWTEFVLLEDGKINRKTAVSFGYKKGKSLTEPMSLRLNDYVNNSTAEWRGVTFSSWEDGFAEILGKVGQAWKIGKVDTAVVCPERVLSIVQKHLSSVGGNRIRRVMEPAACIAQFAARQMTEGGEPGRKVLPKSLSDLKKASVKNDIWEL